MTDIKSIVAKNITDLRMRSNLTQMELAEKLNYSDKTVSKWERAESTPDVSVLVELAAIFHVTLDYFVQEEHGEAVEAEATKEAAPEAKPKEIRYNRRAISYIAEGCGWTIAVFAFIITTLILNRMTFQWLYFVYALPVTLIVKLIFNSIWFNPRHNYLIVSALMWSVLATVHITFFYFGINVALIYLLGVAGQAVIVLWSFIGKPKLK